MERVASSPSSLSTMRPTTPNFNYGRHAHPSSPPATPTTYFRPSTNTRATPAVAGPKRRDMVAGIPSPSAQDADEAIRPIGDGPHFSFRPSIRPQHLSPQSSGSSSSSSSTGSPPRSPPDSDMEDDDDDDDASDDDDDTEDDDDDENDDSSSEESSSDDEDEVPVQRPLSSPPPSPRRRVVAHGNFTVTEVIESDVLTHGARHIEVLHPSNYSEADTDDSSQDGRSSSRQTDHTDSLADSLAHLDWADDATTRAEAEHEEYIRARRAERRNSRLSSGSLKRPFPQTLCGDRDDLDLQPPQLFPDSSPNSADARRLRRKVAEDDTIVEEREPIDDLAEMPYYDVDSEAMETD